MDDKATETFQMRVSLKWLDEVDEWRRHKKPIPSRAAAIRTLVVDALQSKEIFLEENPHHL